MESIESVVMTVEEFKTRFGSITKIYDQVVEDDVIVLNVTLDSNGSITKCTSICNPTLTLKPYPYQTELK